MPASDPDLAADERTPYSSPDVSNVDSEEDGQRSKAVNGDDEDDDASVSVSDQSAKSASQGSVASHQDEDDENQDAKSEGHMSVGSQTSDSPPAPPPKVHRGLLVEDKFETSLPTGDLVIIHGLCATAWYLDAVPDSGCRGSTSWLFQNAGFAGWQYLSYFFPLNSTDTTKPLPFYRNGIEHEALLLLDGLVAWRKELKERYSDEEVDERPIAFIAHDIGGTIVKKALHIAALNPDKYGDITYCTTIIIFLGCPHRSTSVELQDSFTKLVYMTENKWQPQTPEGVANLAEMVEYTNGEFYDTNMLIRATIFNVYNTGSTTNVDGDEIRVQAPFYYNTVILDTPWEYFKPCSVPHNELVNGGELDEGTTDNHFAQTIRNEKDDFPTGVATFWGPSSHHIHKIFLSMAPPCLPAQPTQFRWQPYLIEDWFVGHEPYKEWLASTGIGILHAHGNSHLTIKSQELFAQLQGRELIPNILYFEFRRHDCRFNNLEGMLKSFIAHIITRVPQRNATRDDYWAMMPLLSQYEAMSLTDLMHIFRTMLMWRHIPPLVFMIACLDECDTSKNRILGLIYSLREFTEMRHRFVVTSLPDEGLMSRLAGNYSINLDDFDTSTESAWTDTFEKTYELQLGLLVDVRPVFKSFMPHVREILASCGTDYRLGHLIVRWLLRKKANPGRDTKQYAQRLLESLEPVSADRTLNTILNAFESEVDRARTYLDWVTVAFRPLTLLELGTAVDFTESPTQDTLDYLDFQSTRADVERFGMVFVLTDNSVDLWLPYYQERMHYDEAELERAHGRIAEVCLDYLLMDSVQKMAREFCARFEDPLAVVPFAPKDSLLSYAAQHWTLHYGKAGANKPFEKAKQFFQDIEARNSWRWFSQMLNPPILREVEGFISPLPYVASTGLLDLIEAQLEIEAQSKTLKLDAGVALIQAASYGHKEAMALIGKHIELTKDLFSSVIDLAAVHDTPDCVEEILSLASAASLEPEFSPVIVCRAVWVGWKDVAKNLYDALVKEDQRPDFPIQPLHLAVEHGDESLVEMVIGWTEDINARDAWGRTPLHLAASVGDPAIIRTLIVNGADIEAEFEVEADGRGSLTPLQLATASGNHLALDVLLENKAKLNIGSDELVGAIGSFFEAPPLIYAAGMGFVKCVKVLLQHEPDLTMKVSNRTALWYAVEGSRLEISRLLLEAGADPNENPVDYSMLLFMPIAAKNHDILDMLLEKNIDVNQESSWETTSRTPLARAAGGGDMDIVTKLLDKGAEPDLAGKDSTTPLYQAAYAGNLDIVNLLLDKGADPKWAFGTTKWTPLHAAYDDRPIIERFVEAGADLNALCDGGTVLYLASKHNQQEVVDFLIEKNADLEVATQRISDDLPEEEFGMTPLCVACLRGHDGIVQSLLKAGANVNYMCKDEKTGEDSVFPLRLGLQQGFDSVVEAILEPRPNVKITPDLKLSSNGTSLLHCIGEYTSLSVVKALVVAGAEVEVLNKAGVSPLIMGMAAKNNEVSEYLISQGANVNHYTSEYGTPLHLACRNSNHKLFKALIDNGADVNRADTSGYHSTLLGVLAGTGSSWDLTEEIARHLLEEAKVDPNAKCRKQPYLPLCRAAWEPCEEMVKYLLEKGADPNGEDAWGMRPVHFAAWFSWSMYTIIREAEGLKDPFPSNKLKMTPLHYAVAGRIWDDGFDEIMEKAGATVNDKDEDGWDAVMWSAKGNYNDPETIEAILKRANEDALWVKGYVTGEQLWSPLKCSRYYGATQAIYDLLEPPEDKRTRTLESGEEQVWDDEAHASREADFKDIPCNMCLNKIYGFSYRCALCDVNVCYKCHRSKEIYDPGHDFEEIGPEFPPQEENAEGGEGGEAANSDSGKPGTSVGSDQVGRSSDIDSDGQSDDGADDEASLSSVDLDGENDTQEIR